MDEAFDVFLSYNSTDRGLSLCLREELRARGMTVWMDEDGLPGGKPWQEPVDEIIRTAHAAAIVVGPAGLGDWQKREMQACLTQDVKRGMRVLPVFLEGCPEFSKLPVFLTENNGVDLRAGFKEEGLDRLVRLLGKEPIKRQPERLPGSPPSLHNLPFLPLGDLFKGRGEDLQALETSLQSSSQATAIVQPHAIHGLGGIGKTRLAVEYAWRSGHRYDVAFFVVADSPDSLRANLAALADPLKLPKQEEAPQEKIVAAVLGWLGEHPRWLLILDNVDTPEAEAAVVALLPRLAGGHVLITSRRSDWPAGVQERPIEKLSSEEAVRFLVQRTGLDDPEQAAKLAVILDGLPLALEQAGAYIKTRKIAFARYLAEWESEREKVLAWHNPTVMQYPSPVAVTWQKTFLELGPGARAVLRLAAFFGPEPIPREMFEQGDIIVENATNLLSKETREKLAVQSIDDAIPELDSYSMVILQDTNVMVHRLVQEVIRFQIPEKRRRDWIKEALSLVATFSPIQANDVRTWPTWNLMRPHVSQVISHADRVGIPEPTASLMNNLAQFLQAKALFHEAEPFMKRALKLIEENYGPDNLIVATCLNNLAGLLHATNRLSEAEPLMRRALAIDEASSNTADVTRDLNNLAGLLKSANRLSEAEPLMRRALAIDEARLGSDHPYIAIHLNNLAELLKDTNRFGEAEPMMRRALAIDEAACGSEHPNVARDLNNLAGLLGATNRLSEAEPMMWRSLAINQAAFGCDHPSIAVQLSNIAGFLDAMNRLSEAEPMIRRAVEIWELSLGPDHPSAQHARRNLEGLLRKMAGAAEGG